MRVAAVLLCAGCTAVFGVHHVGVPVDAVDAPPDVDCATLIDFDGDCIADDVDDCPANPNPAQEDTDVPPDGVGDACDPHPTITGDRLLFFDRFSDPSASAAMWRIPPGAKWNFTSGLATHTDLTDTVGTLQRLGSVDNATSVTIEASFTYHAGSGSSSSTHVAVVVDGTVPDAYMGHSCFVTPSNADPANDTAELEDIATNTTSTAIPAQSDGAHLVIRLTRDPDHLYCHVIHDAMDDSVPTITRTGASWPNAGFLALDARQTSADVHYVVAYVSP